MMYIQRCSKDLVQVGIYERTRLFKVYTICWFIACTGMISLAICYPISRTEYFSDPDQSLEYQRLRVAEEACAIVITVGNISLQLTILVTYLRFSNRLEATIAQRATD